MGVSFLLLLLLLKVFKNVSMQTSYFTKMFTEKRRVLHTKNEQKKISKEAKKQEKLESNQKTILIKIKIKSVLYMQLMHFTQCRAYFRPFMHAIIACMEVPLSKMVNSLFFVCFCVFLHFFSLIYTFLNKIEFLPSCGRI